MTNVYLNVYTIVSFQILFDFEEQFKNIEPNVFPEQWTIFGNRLQVIMSKFYRRQDYTNWQEDIENILLLLAAVPYKLRNNNTEPVLSFKKSISKLIVFRKV